MDGIWFKKCPICASSMTKEDPMAMFSCQSCGWSEQRPLYFCEVIGTYCHLSVRTLRSKGLQLPDDNGQGE